MCVCVCVRVCAYLHNICIVYDIADSVLRLHCYTHVYSYTIRILEMLKSLLYFVHVYHIITK